METHSRPVLPSSKATGAVAEATTTTSFAPVNGSDWHYCVTTMQFTNGNIGSKNDSITHHFGHSPLGSIARWTWFVLPTISWYVKN